MLKRAEFLIASLKLYHLGFPLIHVAENTYETDFNQIKVIFLLHVINLEVSRLELVCYTHYQGSRPLLPFCSKFPQGYKMAVGCGHHIFIPCS